MAKLSQQQQIQKNNNNNNNLSATNTVTTKVKRTRRSVPRDSPPQRSSIYRGVTRLEPHLVILNMLPFYLKFSNFIFICYHFLLHVFPSSYILTLVVVAKMDVKPWSGTGGQVDMKLICGTRIAGMSLRTRKDVKVSCPLLDIFCS